MGGKEEAKAVIDIMEADCKALGFDGIIMTDWVVGNGIMNAKEDIHPSVKPQLVAAAGGDLFMPGCKADFDNMLKGLQNGELSRQQLATFIAAYARHVGEDTAGFNISLG